MRILLFVLTRTVLLVGSMTGLSGVANSQPGPIYLDQGWSEEIRERYYFTPQGSRVMPYAWFMALETQVGDRLFAHPDNLKRYGLIAADKPHALNPGNLPIGFARDPVAQPGEGRYVGFTCAACHTADITINGKRVRIDGGAGNFDLDMFYQELVSAVARTFFDPSAFERFAGRVLSKTKATTQVTSAETRQIIEPLAFEAFTKRATASDSPTSDLKEQLRLRLATFQARLAGDGVVRRPTLASGFGRVDALTQIINALSVTSQKDPQNLRTVNAPTSYPHLWLTPQLEFVQWNPIAANPMGRNGAEVLGVFGSSTLQGDQSQWFASSILLPELHALESWVADLKPPTWDKSIFGSVDTTLVKRGETLFAEHCKGCHGAPPYERTRPEDNKFGKTFIKISHVDYRTAGTDPVYVESLGSRLVRTSEATAQTHEGEKIVPGAQFFLKTVGAIVGRAMNDLQLSKEERVAMAGFRIRPDGSSYVPPCFACLKAGPLTGVWASGPFLHNGSVPTIFELLSPVAERRKVFWTGGRELDRKRLGFQSDSVPGRV